MVIFIHLTPPVITERTALRAVTTHILCCSCGMCFSAAASSENDQGSMNLASNSAPVASTRTKTSWSHHETMLEISGEDHSAQHAQGLPRSKPSLCRCARAVDGLVSAGQGSRLGDARGCQTGHSQRKYPQGWPRSVQSRRQQVSDCGVDQLS